MSRMLSTRSYDSGAALALILVLGPLAIGCDRSDTPRDTDAGGGGTDAGVALMDAGGGTDAGGEIDAGGGTDAGTSDAGAPMDAGATDAGTPMDAGETDAGPGDAGMLTPASRLRGASDMLFAELCACDFTGFADAAECASFGENPAVDTCDDMAYAATMADSMGPLDCLATAREARASCAAAAGCDETMLTACADTEDTAFMACADVPMAYGEQITMCVEADVVGTTASTCPENATASMMTGTAVFTGDTTGAGSDRPTQSCRDSFFCDALAADRAYQWTAPADGTYEFDTDGSLFDTVLSLTDGCTGSELACNDDDEDMMIGLRSRLSLEMTMGQTVIVHVAGCASFDAGTFQVNINAVTP